ncbi:ATP synthase d subunit [Orbilia oligospora]|uniref:ATP synthase subunit d, mitochondrial n=1 Tax=Orbilia oligospora TaxID=2813651 RepID=A0A7C8JWD8_ORBOL|nr:ATP synthase d subunit [Orbilia oligospora]KAF3084289.1 ATP synthase d subunit [Orbilia oligospora]KAF3108363.1 ATP synthase d subunit [Orbilia oligospora]KAF3122585.1 ATP synthase d subunit [Orbilia oligospora]KAF3127675.1 ATP synthase d subunit [Orbilia oligospora]
MASPAAVRSAAVKVDWTRIIASLSLKGSTVSQLQAFKKRNEEARRKVNLLHDQPTEVDFSHYRAILKNQAVVDEIERAYKAFKPVTYDVSKQIKTIENFEAEAVKNAENTKASVDAELADLAATLKNIEESRPLEDLTIDDVANAAPEIDKRTEQMVARGRWQVPGYKEKFGDFSLM